MDHHWHDHDDAREYCDPSGERNRTPPREPPHEAHRHREDDHLDEGVETPESPIRDRLGCGEPVHLRSDDATSEIPERHQIPIDPETSMIQPIASPPIESRPK